jgi:enamine deaminase RidA (YjgF/YER057c/UK114 family)
VTLAPTRAGIKSFLLLFFKKEESFFSEEKKQKTFNSWRPRQHLFSGSSFESDIGYARAVVDEPWIFVSGTTGFDYATMTIAPDVQAQAAQALKNIAAALAQAGAGFADVVRVRYILPDRADFEPCWPLLKQIFGAAPPAATMIVAGLSDPRMRIEIEVTARRRT